MADLTPENEPASGKERTLRVGLDHYKGWDAVSRVKWGLSALMLFGATAVAVWAFTAPGALGAFSHGPLSASHAAWAGECGACHAPGAPLRSDAVRLVGEEVIGEQRCLVCHSVSSHYQRPQDSDQACSACHREHRGEVDLTRVADTACIGCHADLSRLTPPPADPSLASVSAFPTEHPPFRSLPDDLDTGDPGGLGFSHSRHLRLGLTSASTSGESEVFRYADIAESDRGLYLGSGQSPSDAVQLTCASCHNLSSTVSSGGAALAMHEEGVHLPIRFEQHCRACHPLRSGPTDQAPLAPHGLTDEEMRSHLVRQLRSEWFDEADEGLKRELRRPIPGRSRILRQATVSQQREIDQLIGVSIQYLRDRCRECHELTGDGLGVAPTKVSTKWLVAARFNHHAHAAFRCGECHSGADAHDVDYPLNLRKAESERVLIPGLDNCVRCHAERSGGLGGVRHDCVLCHRYHQSGPRTDAAARGGRDGHQLGPGLLIDDFLTGVLDEKAAK